MKYIYIILLMVFLNNAFSQDYPIAPEIWSEPIRIDSVSTRYSWDEAPALTNNLDTLYFSGGDGIYMSAKINNTWQRRVKLDANVNDGTPIRNPSISKDGKRLYTTAYAGYGSWDIWYNDWNTDSLHWNKSQNMGPGINCSLIDYYLFEVSKDTVYVITCRWATDAPAMFVWDEQKTEWVVADSFYYHPLGAGRFSGLSITGDKNKLYFSRRSNTWSDSYARGYELCVCYWDSTIENWGDPYFLNINTKGFQPDTSENQWLGGYDSYPWISRDGKTLFFTSNRDAAIEDSVDMSDIYVSYLLVDENGDSVNYINRRPGHIEADIDLYQNYPNPFNSSTVIKYAVNTNIPKVNKISIKLYDILGKQVATLLDERQNPGAYKISLNGSQYNLSSGIYILILHSDSIIKTRKILYLK